MTLRWRRSAPNSLRTCNGDYTIAIMSAAECDTSPIELFLCKTRWWTVKHCLTRTIHVLVLERQPSLKNQLSG